MNVGTYSYIPLSEAVEAAKEDLRIQGTTEHDAYLFRLADEALRHVGALKNYVKKVCTKDIEDGTVELPCGFMRLIGMRLSDSNGNCFNQPYIDNDFLTSCGCNEFGSSSGLIYNQYEIQDGQIVFHDPTGLSATTATLAYLGRNVDPDGVMYMSDREERGVAAYLCYRFALAYPEGYTPLFVRENKGTWIMQKKYLRGMSQKERFEENKRQIASIFKAWIISDQNV